MTDETQTTEPVLARSLEEAARACSRACCDGCETEGHIESCVGSCACRKAAREGVAAFLRALPEGTTINIPDPAERRIRLAREIADDF